MAEAIENMGIDFPTENETNPNIDSELKNQILGFNIKESMDNQIKQMKRFVLKNLKLMNIIKMTI